MSTGADHDISNALAVIADEIYGVDLYALPDRCQAAVKQQIAASHGRLLAVLVMADAQFQTSVESGKGGVDMTNAECASSALQACCLAAIPQQFKPRARFDLAKLPAELRRPAAALMHSASSFMLMQEGRAIRRCHRWAGADWTLTPWENGCLHIAPCAGGVGLLTLPGTLF